MKLEYFAVLELVYDRWGINDADRVRHNVSQWCFMRYPKDTYDLAFSDNGRQVVVRALFAEQPQLVAFKARFAPKEDGQPE